MEKSSAETIVLQLVSMNPLQLLLARYQSPAHRSEKMPFGRNVRDFSPNRMR
jgi:hypothetical protein